MEELARTDEQGAAIYSLICSRDGITSREISRELGIDRKTVNRCLYSNPFISDLCYHDEGYRWHGCIRQGFPHEGLSEFCGWYGYVYEFVDQGEEAWLSELRSGCQRIGRNLNDTRGLTHSFVDTRAAMLSLFSDLADFGVDFGSWEIAFELRIRRASWIRIYADVLVVTPDHAFSLEFKMKDEGDESELSQAVKYAPYIQVVLGRDTDVTPALVLTRASGVYLLDTVRNGERVITSSADMLFNVFDEKLGFLD